MKPRQFTLTSADGRGNVFTNILIAVSVVILYSLVTRLGQSGGNITISPQDYAAMGISYNEGDAPVVLFGAKWCPACRSAISDLQKNGIPFHNIDVEENAEGQRVFRQVIGGGGIPVIVIGNKMYRGYNPSLIQKAIANSQQP